MKPIYRHREDVRRWRLAGEAIDQYKLLSDPVEGRINGDGQCCETEYLKVTIGDMPVHGDLLDGYISSRFISLVLAFVSAAYGGLHASAWNHFFPTGHECLIWRISALVVAATGIVLSFICIDPEQVLEWMNFSVPDCVDFVGYIVLLIGFLALIFYCCCRMFLVVEAFLSIRELPIDAYKTPAWTQLIPHL